MRNFLRNNKLAVGGITVTFVLAFVAVFTALRLYSLRAPNAPESNPGATDLQCQNGDQNRDQNMVLLCECANGCTLRTDSTAGGGGTGWVCEQNCRLVPKGTQPQTVCNQVDFVHQGTSDYCGVSNIACGASCQTGGGGTGGGTTPKGLCDNSCTQDSDCEGTSPTGAQITCNKTIGKCVNKLCPNDTAVGNNCDCKTAVQQCGQPCGGGYPLCGSGFTCVYTQGPSCVASSVASPTSYCVPNPQAPGYSFANCVSRDQGNSYLVKGTQTTFTPAQVALACAAPISFLSPLPSSSVRPRPSATVSPLPSTSASPTATPGVVSMACSTLTFTLTTGTATPTSTATATPTSTATATPTGTATATPTGSATATPTGTATATPTGSATTTPTSTATSTPTGTGSTSTPTMRASLTPSPLIALSSNTPAPELPKAGIGFPTILIAAMGLLLMGLAIFLAL